MKHHAISSAIMIASTAMSSCAAFALWASGTSLCRVHLGRMALLNGLIGSIRREGLDHLVVLSEARLRRILQRYAAYYNKIRTHRSLDKDAPAFRPVQRIGNIASQAILGGLHHHYVRV